MKTYTQRVLPESWNQNLFFSIYESGEKDDPNDYRGITLYNCLGKLLSRILYKMPWKIYLYI